MDYQESLARRCEQLWSELCAAQKDETSTARWIKDDDLAALDNIRYTLIWGNDAYMMGRDPNAEM